MTIFYLVNCKGSPKCIRISSICVHASRIVQSLYCVLLYLILCIWLVQGFCIKLLLPRYLLLLFALFKNVRSPFVCATYSQSVIFICFFFLFSTSSSSSSSTLCSFSFLDVYVRMIFHRRTKLIASMAYFMRRFFLLSVLE